MDRESLMDILVLSRTSINELFTDLFREKRGFKYFITVTVTLKNVLIMDLMLEDLILIQQ